MSALQPLRDLVAQDMQPRGRQIWLGLGFAPMKRNVISINPEFLPSCLECSPVAGLDVILCIRGREARYGSVWRLCQNLLAANPRRLQLIDLDFGKIAFLKLGGRA